MHLCGHCQVDGQSWYGGGCDLTPVYLFEEDAIEFHTFWKVNGGAGLAGCMTIEALKQLLVMHGRTTNPAHQKIHLWGLKDEQGEHRKLVDLARRPGAVA